MAEYDMQKRVWGMSHVEAVVFIISVLKNGLWSLSDLQTARPPLILVLYLWNGSGVCIFTNTLCGDEADSAGNTEGVILNLCFMLARVR